MAWSLSRSRSHLHNIYYAHVTAHDSVGHVKKCLFGKFSSDVHGGSVGRASVFHVKVVGSNLALVTLKIFFFFLIIA